jgi:signal transduction histidine kinase
MTGNLLLDWAIQAVSVFNAIITTWLGLTIVLNAERRVWGIWAITGGLLFAALFFVSHSVIISEGFNIFSRRVDIWWHIGWWPVIFLPLLWYMVTLWYAGFWDKLPNGEPSALYRRQGWPFVFTLIMVMALCVLLVVANPLPSLAVDLRYAFAVVPLVGGVPLLIVAYPIYIILCIGLSFDALLRPGPSERMMGDLARLRARPWLLGTAIALLVVSLLVAWVMFWVASHANSDLYTIAYIISAVDLVVASCIAGAILCVGQAVVVYEVFTGKPLPRHGLQRHWRRAILLAIGSATMISAGLTLHVSPIYQLLGITALMIVFFALSSWRIFSEREHFMRQLRPFVTSQRLYDHLLTPAEADLAPSEMDVTAPLRALADDILDAREIVLAPIGPLAPLVGAAVSNLGSHPTLPALSEITANLTSPQTICLPLDPAHFGGAQWAVPLWSERGLIGLLLLSEKRDGSLYTQEEIELARTSGERLIDTRASAEMGRRLMAMQRQSLAESQVIDRRARRVLHDDILPQLHAAMLRLNGPDFAAVNETTEVLTAMTDVHRRISDLLHDLPPTAPEVSRLGLVGALKHLTEGELAGAFDTVRWPVAPSAEKQIPTIPALTAEVIFYAAREAMRNAAKYGRGSEANGPQPLCLTVSVVWAEGLRLTIEDNGVGMADLSVEGSANGGSGSGLALHSTMMAVVGGTLSVEATPGAGRRVVLWLPRS